MTSASNMGKFIVGALVGGAIGAAFAMLLAPRSGVETRAMIRKEFDDKVHDAGNTLREKKETFKEKTEGIKDKFAEVASELEEAGRRALGRFSSDKSETT